MSLVSEVSEVSEPAPVAPEQSRFAELREEVYTYLHQHGLKLQGPRQMYLKATFILCSWLVSYYVLLVYGPGSFAIAAAGICALTFFTIAIELSVMHDVSHKALSDSGTVNTCLNVTLTLVGACSILWHQKHIVRHHTYTNVHGADPDIESGGLFRLHPHEPWYPLHRWQHLYAWALYSLIIINWMFNNDVRQTIFNTYRLRGRRYAWLWVEFVASKLSHLMLFVVFPYMFFGSWLVVAALYLVHWLTFGLFISVIFQLAHVSGNQTFPEVASRDWALHQLATTSDFAPKGRFLTWICGGLNFQVEHHLFPRICHVHYPRMQALVKDFCERHGLRYNCYPTFFSALKAHYRHLRALGAGPEPA